MWSVAYYRYSTVCRKRQGYPGGGPYPARTASVARFFLSALFLPHSAFTASLNTDDLADDMFRARRRLLPKRGPQLVSFGRRAYRSMLCIGLHERRHRLSPDPVVLVDSDRFRGCYADRVKQPCLRDKSIHGDSN